jgi:DNA polymerase III alpha subunit (gram-positive type)
MQENDRDGICLSQVQKSLPKGPVVSRCSSCQNWELFVTQFLDNRAFDDTDEYCPHCDNHYILDAAIPQMVFILY